jgi:hypothetical protein
MDSILDRTTEASPETTSADRPGGQLDDPASAAGQTGLSDSHGRQVAPR